MSVSPPLCSVIVPVYKHEQWLRECLDSVLLQTFPRLELIVIDDHSPDGSFELARSLTTSAAYARRFERIVCQRNASNQGAHNALNTGVDLARGEYLFLLNSDDRFHPARISRMVAEMLGANARFSFSGIVPLSMPGSQIPPALLNGIDWLEFRAPFLPSLSFAFLKFNCTVTTGNFAVRRDLADKVGPFIALKLTHDWDYVLRVIVHEEPLYVVDALYDYRLHSTNSFSNLEEVAIPETQICLARFFQSVQVSRLANRLCPSPANWPLVFESYVKHFGLSESWNRAKGAGGRRTLSRIVRPNHNAVTALGQSQG